jgi:hypothetical protein
MVLDVGVSPDSLMCLWAISSTSLGIVSLLQAADCD